jgi:hypothetical protein
MPMFVPDYDGLYIHKAMLRDKVRMDAYIAAIDDVVTPGSVVVDIGTGTGVLSLAAARAGARRVVAFERARIVELAKRNFAANFPADRIEAIAADSRSYEAPGAFADILVSEWLGVHAFQENMLAAVLDARDRFLRPPAIMVPSRVDLWIAPLRDNPLRKAEIDSWQDPFYGFDLREIARASLEDPYNTTVDPACVAGRGTLGLCLDMNAITDRALYPMRGSFACAAGDVIEGICGWFDAQLSPRVRLQTSPFMPPTHWGQAIYPFAAPIAVAAGETLVLEVDVEPREGYCELSWRGHVAERRSATAREHSTKNNYLIPRRPPSPL